MAGCATFGRFGICPVRSRSRCLSPQVALSAVNRHDRMALERAEPDSPVSRARRRLLSDPKEG